MLELSIRLKDKDGNLLLVYHLGLIHQSEVLELSLKDGARNSSGRHSVTYRNGQFQITPKPQDYDSRKREPKLTRILVEAHDGLLFMVPERELDYYGPIVRMEMERPISFDNCSL